MAIWFMSRSRCSALESGPRANGPLHCSHVAFVPDLLDHLLFIIHDLSKKKEKKDLSQSMVAFVNF